MIRKFASTEIIGAYRHVAGGGLVKGAHRAVFDYTPREGFLYVRSRMISSRCNDNYDEFPAEEIAKGYRSFIGKPVFVNHHNEDHRRMRGVIIDAVLHKDANPDGSKDWWTEGLMEIDAVRFPKLAKAILKKHIQRTSMGVDVAYSICSACGNKASTPAEYCRHIPQAKGSKIWRADQKTGKRQGELVREICHGLGFFENSLLVEDPADPTAFFLGDVEMGPGLDHLAAHLPKIASIPTAPRRDLESRRPSPVDVANHELRTAISRTASRRVESTLKIGSLVLVAGSRCPRCRGMNTVAARGHVEQECFDCGHDWTPVTASMVVEAAPRHENPADHPWFQETPVHHSHIVDHWNKATDDEKESGRRWYADAHLVAGALGEKFLPDHPHGPAHAAAGLIAVYSPQMGWAGNLHNAARAMHEKRGLGGKGSGMMASAHQAASAQKIIDGENYENVLKSPKISDFAHLIEHGKDKDPAVPKTVVDRHALGVAAGRRMSDKDYGGFPTGQRHYYGHVVAQYNEAARHISEKEVAAGREPVAAHQVQAVTWLTRQRLNQEEEKAKAGQDSNTDRLNKGREVGRSNQEKGWESFRDEHGIQQAGPGTGYVDKKESARKDGGRLPQGARFREW